jgi:hypothetical protein
VPEAAAVAAEEVVAEEAAEIDNKF